MEEMMKCPNCGAQISVGTQGSPLECPYCGGAVDSQNPQRVGATENNGLGYSPDPPPEYSAKEEAETPEKKEAIDTIVVDGKTVEIPPDVIPTVIQTGRTISRYLILAIAAVLLLCSACFIFAFSRN